MKKWQRLLCFAGTALAATSLVACGSGKSASTEKGGNTKLLMYQIGEKPDNFDKLMEIANKRIKEKTGATIDMQYIGWGEWGIR